MYECPLSTAADCADIDFEVVVARFDVSMKTEIMTSVRNVCFIKEIVSSKVLSEVMEIQTPPQQAM